MLAFVAAAAGAPDVVGNILFNLMFASLALVFPAPSGFAINSKYRLYDLDIVVRKTVVLAVVAGAITIVYAVVAVGIPLRDPGVSSNSGFDAFPLIAAAPWPSRSIRSAAAHGDSPTGWCWASGRRPTRCCPRSASGSATPTPPTTCCRAWRACWRRARVRTRRLSGCASPGSYVPRHRGRPSRTLILSPRPGRPSRRFPDEDAFEIRDRGELLGAITLRMPASDPMDPGKSKLVATSRPRPAWCCATCG